jgi:hypothetical protein
MSSRLVVHNKVVFLVFVTSHMVKSQQLCFILILFVWRIIFSIGWQVLRCQLRCLILHWGDVLKDHLVHFSVKILIFICGLDVGLSFNAGVGALGLGSVNEGVAFVSSLVEKTLLGVWTIDLNQVVKLFYHWHFVIYYTLQLLNVTDIVWELFILFNWFSVSQRRI